MANNNQNNQKSPNNQNQQNNQATQNRVVNGTIFLSDEQFTKLDAKGIISAAGDVVTHGSKTQENDFYEFKKRVEKAEAVASLAAPNFYKNQEVNRFKTFMQNNLNNGSMFNIDNTPFFNNDSTTQFKVQIANVTGTNGSRLGHFNITRTDIDNFAKYGSTTKVINGNLETFHAPQGSNLSSLAQQSIQEHELIDRVTGAITRKEKIQAMSDLRNQAITNMQKMYANNINAAPGQTTNLLKDFKGTRKDCEYIMRHGNAVERQLVQTYYQNFGFLEDGHRALSNMKRKGAKIVANYMMGDDFSQAYNFVDRSQRVVKQGVYVVTLANNRMVENSTASAFTLLEKTVGHIPTNGGATRLSQNIRRAKDRVLQIETESFKKIEATVKGGKARKKLRIEDRQKRNVRKAGRRERARIVKSSKLNEQQARINRIKNSRIKAFAQTRLNRNVSGKAQTNVMKHGFNGFRNMMASARRKAKNSIAKLTFKKLFEKVTDFLVNLATGISEIKTTVYLAIAGVLAVLCLIIIIGGGAGAVLMNISSLFASVEFPFEKFNYVQNIVDSVYDNLQKPYEEVAKRDARLHFSDEKYAIESDNYEWYCAVGEGDLGLFYDEHGNEVGSICNLIPLVSMMHYRFTDELNATHFLTAKAYVYYMWVQTHHIGGPPGSGIPAYDYDRENIKSHLDSELKECNNVYYHGYDKKLSLQANKNRVAVSNALANLSSLLGSALPDVTTVTGEVPSDSKGDCDHYKASGSKEINEDVCPGIHKHSFSNGCYTYENCTHIHDANCGPASNPGTIYETWPYCNHKHTDDCKKLVCKLEEHKSHDKWESEDNPGCYLTDYKCLGHCGSHIEPIVNLWAEFEYESIAAYDDLKATNWVLPRDFKEDWIQTLFTYNNLSKWHEAWDNKVNKWFDKQTAPGKDKFAFYGWKNADGSINQSLMKDLEGIYGSREDDWAIGVDTWEEFDVVFPLGSGRTYSNRQIDAVIALLCEKYPNKFGGNEKRQKVVKTALEYAGKFTYKMGAGGITATSGRSDCSGFVSSVLYHADIGYGLKEDSNHVGGDRTASGFGSDGHKKGQPLPGDVCAKNQSSYYDGTQWVGGGPNHVVIYIGDFTKEDIEKMKLPGIDKPGKYVVDCSSSQNGSTFRPINMDNYPWVYDRCFK